jgi:hypothetical protein
VWASCAGELAVTLALRDGVPPDRSEDERAGEDPEGSP